LGGELSATTRKAWEDFQRTHFVKLESHLDACHGTSVLRDPALRSIIQEALLYFENERCRMGAFVVMPNHIHALCHPFRDWPLEELTASWKKHTAQKINRLLGRNGPLWQPESHDRIIRDNDHFRRAVRYVLGNPVKGGLPPNEVTVWINKEVMMNVQAHR
jgi:REP element-mobilizing transposase RayT